VLISRCPFPPHPLLLRTSPVHALLQTTKQCSAFKSVAAPPFPKALQRLPFLLAMMWCAQYRLTTARSPVGAKTHHIWAPRHLTLVQQSPFPLAGHMHAPYSPLATLAAGAIIQTISHRPGWRLCLCHRVLAVSYAVTHNQMAICHVGVHLPRVNSQDPHRTYPQCLQSQLATTTHA
jgi:hypothetical protein